MFLLLNPSAAVANIKAFSFLYQKLFWHRKFFLLQAETAVHPFAFQLNDGIEFLDASTQGNQSLRLSIHLKLLLFEAS